MARPVNIAKWVGVCFSRYTRSPGDIVLSVVDDTEVTVVSTWSVDGEPNSDDLAERIQAVAQGDTDSRGVPMQYQLEHRSVQGETRATTGIRVRPTPGAAGQLLDETADAKGVLGQVMRHMEAVSRSNADLLERSMRMVERQSASLTTLIEAQGKLAEALSERATRAEERAGDLSAIIADDALAAAEGGDGEGADNLGRLLALAERFYDVDSPKKED